MFVIEQPISPAPAADFAANELRSMFEKQARVERFDLIQTFHACKQDKGKQIGAYVLKMKDYVEQLERLGYVLPQDLSVSLILNGLTSDFTGFVRNYNMHNMGKTIGGKIQKSNKKSLKAKGKEHPAKDDTCHHYKEVGHWKRNCPVYLAELLKKKKKVGIANNCHYTPSMTRGVVSAHRLVENGFIQCFTDFGISVSKNNVFYFNAIISNGIYEIDMHDLIPNVNSIYNFSTKRAKHNLDSTYLWHCRLAHIRKKCIEKLQHEGLLKSTDDESFYQCVSCLSGKMTRKSFPHRGGEYISKEFKDYLKACGIFQQLTPPYTPQHNSVSERRNHTLLHIVRSMMNLTTLSLSFWNYALDSAACILNMVLTKKVDKTPYELWYGKVPNLFYLKVWGCEALLKRDTPDKLQHIFVKCIFICYPKETLGYYFYFPPKNKIVVTRKIPMEVEGFEPPQEEVIPIHRSERTHRTNTLISKYRINMASLADKAMLSGADNHPPMLEKDMYDSWKSRMELYMLNRQHGRMILESVEHGPLLWPTVEEDGVTRLKKYSELSAAEAIQADCDVKATNIILQALPLEIYALVRTHKVAKDL
nr:retrovirus-related Pol polyprotein from transposon TNT 1-94 [Tanacetum cinerariifolium]